MKHYLVLGSGLSALAFSALMAKKGEKVTILEAHEHFGGYGHTFKVGDYSFNAQLHYVTGCGEGGSVNRFLKKMGLDKTVTFERLHPDGYDRMYCNGTNLNIPYGLDNLQKNMLAIDPKAAKSISRFIDILKSCEAALNAFPSKLSDVWKLIGALPSLATILPYRSSTLQEVFDACALPKMLQTLVAGQLIDYMLPPDKLSFIIWAALFISYCQGAYYPTHHFQHVVDAMCDSIRSHGGVLKSNEKVVEFIMDGKTVKGVYTQAVDPKTGVSFGPLQKYLADVVICNFDPKEAANMIGIDLFSTKVQKALNYDYSWSSFVLYGVVEGIDMTKHGFGNWNIWHCQPDHTAAFEAMYERADYSKPYFATNCRSLITSDTSNCNRSGAQIFQICTVANYDYWEMLRLGDYRAYNKKKQEVLDYLLDAIETHYVPKIRDHLVLKMTGSPTTNRRYVFSPKGGSYGVNLTPHNFQLSRKLTAHTSLGNLYFCSAAAGYGGFSGTIYTGSRLYERLSDDTV